MSDSERAGELRELVRSLRNDVDSRFERVDLKVRRRGERVVVGGMTTSAVAAGRIASFIKAHPEGSFESRIELADGGEREERIYVQPSAPVVNFRQTPSHAAQLLTQAIPGDALQRLADEGDWTLVRGEDGYLGWVARSGLSPLDAGQIPSSTPVPAVRVTALYAPLRAAPEDSAPVVHRAPFDANLALLSTCEGWFHVLLAAGGEAWLSARDGLSEESRPRFFEPKHLVNCLRRMIGVPYLWGGGTPLGFDCSGLVQRIFRHHKIMLPRDSDLQARAIDDPSPNRALHPGSLLFFGADKVDHVAISLGGTDFVHASGSVKMESLDSGSPLYREDLKARYIGSGVVRNFGMRAEATDLY